MVGAVGCVLLGIPVTLLRQCSPIHVNSETSVHGDGPRTTPESDPTRTRLLGKGPDYENVPDRPELPGQWVPGHDGQWGSHPACTLGAVKVPILIPMKVAPGLAGSDENPHVSKGIGQGLVLEQGAGSRKLVLMGKGAGVSVIWLLVLSLGTQACGP